MDDAIRVQATLAGVKPERYEALSLLGITVEQFPLFERYNVETLRKLSSFKTEPAELVKLAEEHDFDILMYADLRSRGISAEELQTMDYRRRAELLAGLKAKLPLNKVREAISVRAPVSDVVSAREAKISFADIFEVAATRQHSLGSYVHARNLGYSHEELLAILQLEPPYGQTFGVEKYHEVRMAGISREQIMAVLRDERITSERQNYYLGYIMREKDPMSHDEAYNLAAMGVDPNEYYRACREATPEQILEVVSFGKSLPLYRELRAENCRVTHQEVLQYMRLKDSPLSNLNGYIKLLDAGFTFEDILEARKAGLDIWDFERLRSAPISLTQVELLEVAKLNMKSYDYAHLRESGVSHATIIESAQATQAA